MAHWSRGAELLIASKSMLSSYGKNLRNRFEESYGDAANQAAAAWSRYSSKPAMTDEDGSAPYRLRDDPLTITRLDSTGRLVDELYAVRATSSLDLEGAAGLAGRTRSVIG